TTDWFRLRIRDRQVDRELAALTRLAMNPDFSVVLLHDSVDRRETEAGSLALTLGGEEWLKDVSLGLFCHPMTSVSDGVGSVFARPDFKMRSELIFAQVV